MPRSKIEKLLKLWQDRLKLSDWNVRIVMDKMLAEHGTVQWDDLTKEATIHLYPAKEDARIEKVIIHELLHIVLKKWGASAPLEESIIHLTSVFYDITR